MMSRRHVRALWLLSSLAAVLPATFTLLWADTPPEAAFGHRLPIADAGVQPPTDSRARAAEPRHVRLNCFHKSWTSVLRELAEATGSTLVMHEPPPGHWTRRDRRDYSRSEAVRILNRDLEPLGFRLLEQGEYLILLNLKSLRSRYLPPVVPAADPRRDVPAEAEPNSPNGSSGPQRRFDTVSPRSTVPGRFDAAAAEQPWRHIGEPARGASSFGVVPASYEAEAPDPANSAAATEREWILRPIPTRRPAPQIAGVIFGALRDRVESVTLGQQTLPAFRVYGPAVPSDAAGLHNGPSMSGGQLSPQFIVAVDQVRNEIVVQAPPEKLQAVVQLVTWLDFIEPGPNGVVQFVANATQAGTLPKGFQPVMARLAQRPPEDQVQPPAQPPEPQAGPPAVAPPAPAEGTALQIEGIKGPVTIREVPGIGLVVTGNKDDVEAVVRIIRELDKVGRGSTPDIHLLMLRHVHSAALAELLNTVYEQLGNIREGRTTDRKTISVVPVIKPNAVLILASGPDLEAVLKLAEELDQPVAPGTELEVFPLASATAEQVVQMLESFYAERGGLGARVIAAADVRTNSVVVQARPNDMAEIRRLLQKIDRDESAAVSRMRVFVLKNAVAEELAEVISTALQSVLSPPALAGQLGAVGAVGDQATQQLRAAKSVVLELLQEDAQLQESLRSGLLSDVRVTADPRTNSLVVTAPERSMALIAALIAQLDQPTSTVAELKVFTLANADAFATAELLRTLFEPPATQQRQLGVQIAGADDASSSLIPLRFSVDVRTNSVIAIGGAEALRVVEAILLRLDESDVRQRKNIVIRLKNSPVTEVANAINQFLQSQRQLAQVDPELVSNMELLEREIIVVPEIVTNSLLISATPRYFGEVQELVARLDEAPAQVIIQALLVEVELDNTDEFGVELGFQDSLLFDRSVVSNLVTLTETVTSPNGVQTTTQNVVSQEATPGFLFNNQQLGNNTAIRPSSVGTQGLSNFSLGRINGDLGFGGLVLSASSESVSVLIRALASKRRVQVLSRPQIRTLDNQLAQIQVGQQVPIVDGVNVTATGVTNPLIRQDQAGIILTVTPRISPDGTIVMETVAEKSQFGGQGVPIFTDATTGNVIESPIKDITTARTTVAVPNGQTVVLGGMITTTEDTLERKVPWLGDIPILGTAFRYDGRTTLRRELLIFLTPRIIRGEVDSEMISRVEAERLHFFQEEAELLHGPLFAVPAETPPDAVPQPLFEEPPPHPAPMLPPTPTPALPRGAASPSGTSGIEPAGHLHQAAAVPERSQRPGHQRERERRPTPLRSLLRLPASAK